MAINGKVGSFSFEGERAHTTDHPPVIRTGTVKAANGEYPAGLVVMRDANGDLVPYTDAATDTPVGVIDEPVDTTTETTAMYLAHGTAKSAVLVKGAAGDALVAADLIKLEASGIFAV